MRGGKREWEVCEGSGREAFLFSDDVGDKCPACGKVLVITRAGNWPRHKPLSKIVQDWE